MKFLDSTSHRDLLRRLRKAGDDYFDVRCLIAHETGSSVEHGRESLGYLIGTQVTTPVLGSADWWDFFFYQRKRREPLGHQLRSSNSSPERANEKWQAASRIMDLLEQLMQDAYWLGHHIGFSKVPGTDNIDVKKLYPAHTSWLWLLFHAAWECPAGSLLRARRFFPTRLVAKHRLHEKKLYEVGFEEPPIALADLKKAEDAIRQRDLAMSQEERSAEEMEIYFQVQSEARGRLQAGEYISVIPLDPFTASAELLEIMASTESGTEASGSTEPTTTTTQPTAKTLIVIRAIQSGKTNEEVAESTKTSIGNVRLVRSRLRKGRYSI